MKQLIELLLIATLVGSVRGADPSLPEESSITRTLLQSTERTVSRVPSTVRARSLPLIADRPPGPTLRDPGSQSPIVSAESAIMVDRESGKVLFDKNSDFVRPIASITKLMTALVFLETQPDLASPVEIALSDQEPPDSTIFRIGDTLTVRDLLFASLVGSANDATRALVRASGLPGYEFVRRMNSKARALGMEHARFVDPTGIDPRNAASARELVVLLRAAGEVSLILEATQTSTYRTPSTAPKARRIESTNLLLGSFINQDPYTLVVGKTGSLDEAGFCLVASIDEGDHGVIVVVLGSENHFSRFEEVKALAHWAFTKWKWPETLVHPQ